MPKSIATNSAVVVFDIRNFSSHRYLLGKVSGGGRLLTELVKNILNDAVSILNSSDEEFYHFKRHFLNHTGDGFVLVIRGSKNPLVALLWISEFRAQATYRIKKYQSEMKRMFPRIENELPRLGFGIGAHFGLVVEIEFDGFGGLGVGVLGSSINIASRVEQCTKDHDSNVLLTGRLRNAALEIIPFKHQKIFAGFCKLLGKHRLRGFDDRTFTFYEFKPNFHKTWAQTVLNMY